MLARRSDLLQVSKVGTQDDATPRDVKELEWMRDVFQVLAVGKKDERLWDFTDPELVKEIKKQGLLWGQGIVPC